MKHHSVCHAAQSEGTNQSRHGSSETSAQVRLLVQEPCTLPNPRIRAAENFYFGCTIAPSSLADKRKLPDITRSILSALLCEIRSHGKHR